MSPIAAAVPRPETVSAPPVPAPARVALRRLTPADRDLLLQHLLRLDAASRRSRFAALVGDEAVRRYAEGALGGEDATIGLFADGALRGVAELRACGEGTAEGAFSLESDWQGRGHGQRMFGALLETARRRGVRRLVLQCLRENAAMQRIARRFQGTLSFEDGEVIAEIRPLSAAEAAASRTLARLAARAGVALADT